MNWRHISGFSYVEVLVAVALLALCAVPAADAIRHGIGATSVGAAQARELRCLKNTMETVLTEPYDNLWIAVRGADVAAPAYSLPADADGTCGARDVYIAKYVHPYGSVTGQVLSVSDTTEDTLLLVRVSAPDSQARYSLTTLVDR